MKVNLDFPITHGVVVELGTDVVGGLRVAIRAPGIAKDFLVTCSDGTSSSMGHLVRNGKLLNAIDLGFPVDTLKEITIKANRR